MPAHIIFILHTHLPYIEEERDYPSIEESWFFEAIIESYIPLIRVFERLINKRVPFKVVLSVSPTLLDMLEEEKRHKRLTGHIERLKELSERELKRTEGTPFNETVRFYRERLKETEEFLKRETIVNALRRMNDSGYIETVTTARTHAYLPLFAHYPFIVWLQIKKGLERFKQSFNPADCYLGGTQGGMNIPPCETPDCYLATKGFWLPECGYYEGLDLLLKRAGIKWSILEGHGVAFGDPPPEEGIFRPIISPEGIIFFGRDSETCNAIWSKDTGYPGNPWYREFYRDICYELDDSEWRRFRPDGIRHHTGLKYYRITGNKEKRPYIRQKALNEACSDAEDFIKRLHRRAEDASELTKEPIFVLAFDTELFGHWWFEGPEWLERVLELLSQERGLKLALPGEIIDSSKGLRVVTPLPSSWGEGGFHTTWISEKGSPYLRAVYRAIEDFRSTLTSPAGTLTSPVIMGEEELMNAIEDSEILRELLLMQSSDFLFMLKRDPLSRDFAERRLRGHLERFYRLLPRH